MAEVRAEEDLEEGSRCVDDTNDDGLCFCDAEVRSWHSSLNTLDSNCGADEEECKYSNASDLEKGMVADPLRNSDSECLELDSENGEGVGNNVKLDLSKVERDCRICHLDLESGNQESGVPIELGCSCKDDLAAAHKQCAEAWFKIKGDKTCEICGSTAQNVVGIDNGEFMEQWTEASVVATASLSETRNFQHGHRFVNFLLGCMVFALMVSWLFHFNVLS